MAHQDYVSRPRSTSKKKNPYKKKPTPKKSEGLGLKFKLIGLITIMLIGTGAYFLWTLKDVEPINTSNNTTLTVPKTDDNTSSEESSLPLPPKEKWTYVDELKTKEVEVGEYEVKNGGPYQMQCGSFKTQSQADSLKATIAFSGIESQVKRVTGNSGIWYKVILGPYDRKRTAEKDKHKLSRNNVNHCQIWGWR